MSVTLGNFYNCPFVLHFIGLPVLMTKISIFNNSIFLQFYSNWEEKYIEQRKKNNSADSADLTAIVMM